MVSEFSERSKKDDQEGRVENSRFNNMSDRIEIPLDNKHTNAFKKVYDKLFADFKDQLL
jgi:hypothetical protein